MFLPLTAVACLPTSNAPAPRHLTRAELVRCAARGEPITLGRLVKVFRKNGITLSITEKTCSATEKERTDGAPSDATNGGRSGLENLPGVERREGFVLCTVYLMPGPNRNVYVTKHSTDTETYVDALNVNCAVYPLDQASETQQVARLRRAMIALVAELPHL